MPDCGMRSMSYRERICWVAYLLRPSAWMQHSVMGRCGPFSQLEIRECRKQDDRTILAS